MIREDYKSGMIQEDYIMRMIEQFVKVLAQIIGLKQKGEFLEAMETVDEAYNSLLRLDRNELLRIPAKELIEKFNHDQLSVFADLLFEEGDIKLLQDNENEASDRLKKALEIYEYLNEQQKIYSFDRENKIERIKKIIGNSL